MSARRWSPVRVASGAVLAAWAGLFWFLMATGRSSLYLSSRTGWLVPVGAVVLGIAAIARLVSAKSEHPSAPSRRETLMLGAVSVPVILLLALPPTTLGTYSASRRSSFAGSGIGATARSVTGELDFVDVGAAQSFDSALEQLRQRAGEQIVLEGFVTREPGQAADEMILTRYIVTCCVADATVARVLVVGAPAGEFSDEDWVRVTGRVYPVGRDVLVAAEVVEGIPVPEEPYLTP